MKRASSNWRQAHWSKDYVEHLRTVHLALIATCVALVIVALTTKHYSTAVAARQLNQIQDLRKQWGIKFFKTFAVGNVRNEEADRIEEEFEKRNPGVKLTFPLIHLIDEGGTFRIDRNRAYRLVMQLPSDSSTLALRANYKGDHSTMPNTISDLEKWWNELTSPEMWYLPVAVSGIARAKFEDSQTWEPIRISGGDGTHSAAPKPKKIETCKLFVSNRIYYAPTKSDFRGSPLELWCSGNGASATVPIKSAAACSLDTRVLMKYLGLKESDGVFKHVFSDLYEFAQASGTESFAALESDLAKTDMSETPVFEAFGIKFPADLASVGGTVVLISVQIYFIIYLQRLRGPPNALLATGLFSPWSARCRSSWSNVPTAVPVGYADRPARRTGKL